MVSMVSERKSQVTDDKKELCLRFMFREVIGCGLEDSISKFGNLCIKIRYQY